MKATKLLIAAGTTLALSAALPGAVLAYDAGDIIAKVGIVNVNPKSDSGIDGVTVEDDTQLGLTLTYMLNPNVGFELLGATPFEHEVKAGGSKVATTKHLPPTVSVQYYPMGSGSAIQPYLGVGLNHTFFFDEGGIVDHLGKSTGLSYSAGLNYDINESLLANIAIWKIDIDSELNGSGTDVEIDPTVIFAGIGYKF